MRLPIGICEVSMGNRVFLSLRYLFFVLFFVYQAVAVSQETAWEDISKKKRTNIPCKIKFSDLSFVGINFEGEATCVAAKSDGEAIIKCGGPTARVVNPGNPQYHVNAVGDHNTNPDGYYYCPKVKTKRNSKFHMCNVLAETQSEYRGKDVHFKWYQYDGKTDGLCLCGIGEVMANAAYRDCAQNGPEAVAEIPKEEKAPEAKTSKDKDSASPDSDLVACIADWKKAANECKATADDAQKTCNPKSEEAQKSADINNSINILKNGYVNFKSGSGAQKECFNASLLGSSVSGLLTLQSDSCESKVDLCTSSCDAEELNKKEKACEDILTKITLKYEKEPGQDEASSPTRVNSQYYADGKNYVDEKVNEGKKICETDAKKDMSTLSSMLDSVGESMAASLKCMCQLSSSSNVNCNEIVTPQACAQNPIGVGCSTYGSIAVCTMGAVGYDAKLCNCQMNPKDAGCPGGSLSGGLVGFAGAPIKGGGAGDMGGSFAGGLKPINPSDLAIPVGDQGYVGTPLQLGPGSGSGGSPGAAGGGPGGGGPGGGDSSAKGDAGAPPEEKGISGLFNQAKSFVSSVLGKKSPSNSNSKNGKNENGFDPNKFKPRVPASKRGYGTKNQDIWKMSNSCMYAETCQTNMNNFMDSPLKQK